MEAAQKIENFEQYEGFTVLGGSMKNVEIREIPVNKIKLAKNSRLNITNDELDGLMQSIKEVGLLQPIGVTKTSGGFEIVYGNRRFLAASKLGHKKIPAVIHSNKTDSENDLQNLTENIQRRNISLTEAGRYISLLKDQGLSYAEIAVRLGVNKSYVISCITAYQEVPKEFRKDLAVNLSGTNDRQRIPGKISISAAQKIISADKTHNLTTTQRDALFQAAKSEDSFDSNLVPKYVQAMKDGKKDFLKVVKTEKFVAAQFHVAQAEFDRIERKHITNGPFRTMNSVIKAILKGEIHERVKVL